MPVTLPSPPDPSLLPPHRVRWTRDQCRLMEQTGILAGRYELVDGEVFSKMGQKPAHAYVVRVVMEWLVAIFGAKFVQVQLPIQVPGEAGDYNEPEPDCALLTLPARTFAERHPSASELRLVIEVSDTTVAFDLTTKRAVYARAGIDEYWVIDIPARRLVVCREPGMDGYASITAYSENERCAPRTEPGHTVLVSDLLPPA